MKIQWLKLIGCIILCQAAGLIGMIFTNMSLDTWYAGLQKPAFNPPSWVFGPVWTTLYLLMAISLYIVAIQPFSEDRKQGLIFFYIQLFLNALWSAAFFGLQNPFLGLCCIILLLAMIILTTLRFSKVSRVAAALMYPYIAWVAFASVLNYFLYILN